MMDFKIHTDLKFFMSFRTYSLTNAVFCMYTIESAKMNERGPTGLHTPAALASLAELLTNPPTVPAGQLTSALGTAGISIPENASTEKISPDLDHAMELKPCDNQVNELKAKVNFDLVLFTLLELNKF